MTAVKAQRLASIKPIIQLCCLSHVLPILCTYNGGCDRILAQMASRSTLVQHSTMLVMCAAV